MARKRIYRFETGNAEGHAAWRELLGGKGANLAEMANMGIPVPPGFTLTTENCADYLAQGELPEALLQEVEASVAYLEQVTGKTFGRGDRPLLLSVRSGARVSMPGMMDTILDLGLSRDTVEVLARDSARARFTYDAYRRLLSMFGDVVLGVERALFEAALSEARRTHARETGLDPNLDAHALARLVPDTMLTAEHLREVCAAHERTIEAHTGAPFPSDPHEQLKLSIEAVFRSWNTPRAHFYRSMHHYPEHWGTAVNVQTMVFGNLGDTSATGVAFTRDPATGERHFFGEWLPNAQGEDVVAGIRTPRPISRKQGQEGLSLEEVMPENYASLLEIQARLEKHFRDMQDLEFTIEDGVLYLLQTRNGKRTARAATRIAVEMVDEGLLHPDEAILRVEPGRLQELMFAAVDPKADASPVAKGIAASPGAVSGLACFDADEAAAAADRGERAILVRSETSPEDVHGMKAAVGILTAHGGATSHAAVVARGMGRPCVAGCSSLGVDDERALCEVHGPDGAVIATVRKGEMLTIDGTTGSVYVGEVPTIDAELGEHATRLLGFCDSVRRMAVRANADTPEQAEMALSLGAEGIGLCRTEHMFFDDDRIREMRAMILATDDAGRGRALSRILPLQTGDFEALFRIMGSFPVTIRLLDPPLHEFLPREREQLEELSAVMEVPVETLERTVEALSESNPMLGHRGVRLAVTFPQIPRMQVRAILTAACRVARDGIAVQPEIMIPLAIARSELDVMRVLVDEVAAEVFATEQLEVAFKFGSMVEMPRAALLAGELAERAEFFSFGTNDLTQTTMGLSRDDAASFLPKYVRDGLLRDDPFVSLDQAGVGALVQMAAERGRATRPGMKLGICGEHGGDPDSVDFCDRVGLDYVSCSPMRVPIARIAAAQATLKHRS